MDKKRIADMIENGEQMMKLLENHLKSLRSMAAEMGLDPSPESHATSTENAALRQDMDRLRQDIMEKADADRNRVVERARQALRDARTSAMGAGAFPMAAPGMPDLMSVLPGKKPRSGWIQTGGGEKNGQ
jgi:cell division septum initiation protein DivIVA